MVGKVNEWAYFSIFRPFYVHCVSPNRLPHHSQKEVSPREGSRDTEREMELQTPTLMMVSNLILASMNLGQNH